MEENIQQESEQQEQKDSAKKDENKIFSILSYIGILCLVPLFMKKDDPFVFFHAKQGLVLLGFEIIIMILQSFLAAFRLLKYFSLIIQLAGLGFLVLSIFGIINVIKGEKKELPLIGKLVNKIKI